ncbi:MAG: agmatine deiminase family protein [Hyphomonadaceae bacterium]|nr:agmatine deiminase family protein [Hyphomonadaceae bacterium]
MSIFIPAEWAPRRALWTAWPSDGSLWRENLAPAREEVAAMVRALADDGAGDNVRVLATGEEAMASANAALGAAATVLPEPFGDIWLRDTGPIFARRNGEAVAIGFRFNGWGGKYELEGDDTLAGRIAERAKTRFIAHDFVLEGGAVEGDGAGAFLTTRQCLLNPNRNPGWTEAKAEEALRAALGAKKVLWLDEGLAGDHTDGHIDNLARFVGDARVVCQAPGGDDPNAEVLDDIAHALAGMEDAQGRKLEVVRIPSPGLVQDEDGGAMAASHMNFLIGVGTVVVPVYNARGEGAVEALKGVFPDHRVIGLKSNAILSGGGSFHCITQQEPRL